MIEDLFKEIYRIEREEHQRKKGIPYDRDYYSPHLINKNPKLMITSNDLKELPRKNCAAEDFRFNSNKNKLLKSISIEKGIGHTFFAQRSWQ